MLSDCTRIFCENFHSLHFLQKCLSYTPRGLYPLCFLHYANLHYRSLVEFNQ